jgi:FkbM family methyltransferase
MTQQLIEIQTDYGPLLLPNDNEAISVCEEVIGSDCYNLASLKLSGFSPRLIWDLGASWGVASFIASQLWPECQIWAFEPSATRFEFAAHNLRHASGAHLFNLALVGFWNTSEDAIMQGIAHWAPWRLSPKHYFEELSSQNIKIQSVTEFLQQFELPCSIDLLKIDIEGGEIGVLDEMRHLNLIQSIPRIRGEWHFNALTTIPEILSLSHDVEMRQVGTDWDYFQATMRP